MDIWGWETLPELGPILKCLPDPPLRGQSSHPPASILPHLHNTLSGKFWATPLSHVGVYSLTCKIRIAGVLVDSGSGEET